MTPEVQKIADYIGDSYYLSKVAVELKEQVIVFKPGEICCINETLGEQLGR